LSALPLALAIAAVAGILAIATGCSGTGPQAGTGTPRGEIVVYAASSLTDAFQEIAAGFQDERPGAEVTFSFGGSPTLRAQLQEGARADLFASADHEQMALAVESGLVVGRVRTFARNSLVLIAPRDNPGRIGGPRDLSRASLKVVLANEAVPAGAYARRSIAAMEHDAAFGPGFVEAVLSNVVSLESNVKQVVAKVELGEADAGIVYASDVTPSVAPGLDVIPIPPAFNVAAEYPIALLKEARNPETAEAFIDYVLSSAGQMILRKHGFAGASS
jgi:molybdate transport system substrate-binding protein